ncbi:MAG: bifunctional methylenetetrahydrofolate dehydrogenase/methenyltetrahydrofolate cyclohydrolase FolD [Parvularculaceae bacterium]|nr:bifunctional methylenetetrahydrofolate dehydrogenase/methenyltetrahydrofolate cyclohydrolase FolD [Parvularculaceae bacterium]
MTVGIIDGKAVAASLREKIAGAASNLRNVHGLTPGLAVVLVGDDPASHVYVRNKGIATKKAGMRSVEHRLPADVSEADIVALVRDLNGDDGVDGILVQMPLPDHINAHRVINEIDPEKDVDGLTEANAGKLMLGETGLVPCTPQGSIILIRTVEQKLSGLNAVVVGRSILVGKPLAMLLLAENCTVTLAHSRTKDLAHVCRSADILCAAVGRPEIIKGDFVKDGAIIIDVGINRVGDRLIGDVDFAAASERAGAITPVPGGVGPMTIACLLKNTVLAAARRRALKDPEI